MDARTPVAAGLTADVEANGALGRIALHGRIDREADAALGDAYARATTAGASVVVIDFANVDYINSTGIALVVRLLAEARREGRTVQARGLSDHYREIFTITRLSDFMTIVDDEKEGQA